MSTNVIFVGWNRPVAGREDRAAELFQEYLEYLGSLQQAGGIQSFEPVLLTPHGGDLNGFILIRGEASKLDDLQSTDEWLTYTMRAGILLEGQGFVRGAAGDLVMEQMQLYGRLIER